jgi:hypothetical protein
MKQVEEEQQHIMLFSDFTTCLKNPPSSKEEIPKL